MLVNMHQSGIKKKQTWMWQAEMAGRQAGSHAHTHPPTHTHTHTQTHTHTHGQANAKKPTKICTFKIWITGTIDWG